MRKLPIGLTIKSIVQEKRIPISKLSQIMGVTHQSIYNAFRRVEMKSGEINRWAAALELSRADLIARATLDTFIEDKTGDANKDLAEHLTKLEEKFTTLLYQLEVKDKQIETKDKQIEKLIDVLGKPEDVLNLMASRRNNMAAA